MAYQYLNLQLYIYIVDGNFTVKVSDSPRLSSDARNTDDARVHNVVAPENVCRKRLKKSLK
jgi:hypothetical protein